MSEDFFNDKNRIKSQFYKFGKVGDWFKGTLLSVREQVSNFPGKEGKLVKQYEFRVSGGEYHLCDPVTKQPLPDEEGLVTLKKGEVWIVSRDTEAFDNAMRNVKMGQIFGSKFVELKQSKTKGFNPQKVTPVYAGEMDPDYMGEASADDLDALD